MGGATDRAFEERLSPFLAQRLCAIREQYGEDSSEYRGLAIQYLFDEHEREVDWKTERRRHYEAEIVVDGDGRPLPGMERLYRRVALIDLTTACTSYCRYCLRRGYPGFTLSEEEVERAAGYFGSRENRDDLREILITGGDPLLVPELLAFAVASIARHAPNIQVIRIASRLPVQQPDLVNAKVLSAVQAQGGSRIELATQINHPIELCEEARDAYSLLKETGLAIYNQQVLLKGVSDDLATLVELYDGLRSLGIEAHYAFHCVPVRGIGHLRTSVEEGLNLIRGLTSSGMISGRAKPMYTLMTDIGKVTLYEDSIVDRRGDMVLLQTEYKVEDRRRWNPSWKIPDSVVLGIDGEMSVWYKDAVIHNEGWPSTYFAEATPSLAGKAYKAQRN